MSIASEIARLQQAKSDLATSIANKGVAVPSATTIDGYAALVDQIQTGGGGDFVDVAYIESNGTQYIDTGLTINYGGSTVVQQNCTLAYTVTNVRQLNGSNSRGFYGITANGVFEYAGGTSSVSAGTGWHSLSYTYRKTSSTKYSISLLIDGSTNLTSTGNVPNNNDYDIFIFAIGGVNDAAPALNCSERIASFQIIFNGVLVRNYVPKYQISTSKYGLWDMVEGVFYTSPNGALFTGPSIS